MACKHASLFPSLPFSVLITDTKWISFPHEIVWSTSVCLFFKCGTLCLSWTQKKHACPQHKHGQHTFFEGEGGWGVDRRVGVGWGKRKGGGGGGRGEGGTWCERFPIEPVLCYFFKKSKKEATVQGYQKYLATVYTDFQSASRIWYSSISTITQSTVHTKVCHENQATDMSHIFISCQKTGDTGVYWKQRDRSLQFEKDRSYNRQITHGQEKKNLMVQQVNRPTLLISNTFFSQHKL